MRQLLYPSPSGVARDRLHFEPVEVVIEHGRPLFGERRPTVVLFFPHGQSIIAMARGAEGPGEGAAEGLHISEFVAAKTGREFCEAAGLRRCGDEIMGHDRDIGRGPHVASI